MPRRPPCAVVDLRNGHAGEVDRRRLTVPIRATYFVSAPPMISCCTWVVPS